MSIAKRSVAVRPRSWKNGEAPRSRDAASSAGCARQKRDDVEDLIEMRGHEEADAHHEDENRGAEPLADRDSAQVQGLHDEPPEDQDDEHRPDLGREVEALRHEPSGEIARFRMGTRPVHRAHETELGRERENQRREVVFPVSGRHGCTIMSDSPPGAPDGRTAAAVQSRSSMRPPAPILLRRGSRAAALPAAAQSYSDPGTGYGADAGYARGRDAESGGATGGVHARLRLTGGIGLEVSAGYRHDSFATDGVRVLTVDEIPIAASLLVFFPHDGRVQPYVLARHRLHVGQAERRGTECRHVLLPPRTSSRCTAAREST